MFAQRYDSDWVGKANFLAKQMQPSYDARDRVVQGLEEMHRRLEYGARGVIFEYAGNGYWYRVEKGMGREVLLSIVSKMAREEYFVEHVAKEHFVCGFDHQGKLQRIAEVDVFGMNAESNMQTNCMIEICNHGNTNVLLGAKFTLKKLQKYVDVFTAFQRTAGRML